MPYVYVRSFLFPPHLCNYWHDFVKQISHRSESFYRWNWLLQFKKTKTINVQNFNRLFYNCRNSTSSRKQSASEETEGSLTRKLGSNGGSFWPCFMDPCAETQPSWWLGTEDETKKSPTLQRRHEPVTLWTMGSWTVICRQRVQEQLPVNNSTLK